MVVSEHSSKLEYTEAVFSYHTIGFTTSSDGFVYLVAVLLTDNHPEIHSSKGVYGVTRQPLLCISHQLSRAREIDCGLNHFSSIVRVYTVQPEE